MAQLTSKRVQGDIYNMLRESDLATFINGGVYREGMRPRDSRKEDAVVIFTTGLSEQIQTGVVTVDIYVSDRATGENGVFEEDGQRCEEIETAAVAWVNTLTAGRSNYLFRLQQTIYTEREPETNEHFIVVKLVYKYYDGEE